MLADVRRRRSCQLARLPELLAAASKPLLVAGNGAYYAWAGRALGDFAAAFGIPVVVAVNRFTTDTDKEIETVRKIALEAGADAAVESNVWAEGGKGGEA